MNNYKIHRKPRKTDKEEVSKPQHVENVQVNFSGSQEIEQLSGLKVGKVLFDSGRDNWAKNTSVFGDKILHKQNLLFLVEDDNRNIFGGVLYEKVVKEKEFVGSQRFFVFSLERNGIVNPRKYELKGSNNQYAFYLYCKSHECLFGFGGGHAIGVFKKGSLSRSYCNPSLQSSSYTAKLGDLTDGRYFKVKTIKVYQLD
ncbi:hypothetical protein EIN_258950 [Entamoeba invadens IP1]|uniref:TLDc domain-containing protein n=1 Tax=Entamoeba invadens IP1 TaxID=370355 RepID=A0A0A1TV78_ENTIV|nr:hypothetical protein EIN_258950 [Entamoeba invadens IP1]ELP84201.1 hypothetical protein EIN_258950 [Entamoeba invadens IP1]|eukprot:XP_004183547.1 hypothetical protein EIN_258950 [Entamoeba invadens IP1]